MVRSVLQKSLLLCGLLSVFILAGFKTTPDAARFLTWGNQCLSRVYDAGAEDKLKKFELFITPEYFLRLRKTYMNGKQEYFSCHLRNFEELDYLGTTNAGLLRLRTKADNIIVQTHNDRKGNIDTMATSLAFPVKNMEPEQVDSLRQLMLSVRDSQTGEGN